MLRDSVRVLSVGAKFPSFPVWNLDGSGGKPILDWLPDGGVIVCLASGCQTCRQTSARISHALKEYGRIRADGSHAGALLVILGQPDAELRRSLDSGAVGVPVALDAEERFFREFRVLVNPSQFAVDSQGYLRCMNSGLRTEAEYVQMINCAQ